MKKGQLTATQIISLVLVLGAAVIIFIFWYNYSEFVRSSTPDETCRQSILVRATVPRNLQEYVPLRCSPKKICFSLSNRDECKQFIGEENVFKIKLSTNEEIAARQIEETIALAQYDCWSMTGKGQLDISSGTDKDVADYITDNFFSDEAKPFCLICSRIALSNDLLNTEKGKRILEKVDVIDYMENNRVPGSKLTFLQIFTNEQISSFPKKFEEALNIEGLQNTDQIALVFSQIVTKKVDPFTDAFGKAINFAALAATPTFALTPVQGLVGVGIKVAITAVEGLTVGGIALYNNKKNFKTVNTFCGRFTSAKGEVYGCSFVAPVDYRDVKLMNDLCKGGVLGNL